MSRELREEAQRREEERRDAERRRRQFAADVQAVAALPEGKRLLGWLLERGGIFDDDWTSGPDGAFRAGQRSAALHLWNLLRRHLSREAFVETVLPGEPRDSTPDRAQAANTVPEPFLY